MVYLKKGLRPPAVMVAERYSWVEETEQIGEKEMEDGGEQGEKGMEDGGDQGEKVLRQWVKGVKVRGRRLFPSCSALGILEAFRIG